MPSASAKLEKQASIEANDPLKQITTMVEKKVRNLEKRKAKLDSYRSESNDGKELNEDQKKAMEKYDLVVEVLDFAKELQRSFNTVVQETSKSQKKVVKREYQERQQQELQRIKEIVMIQDILNSMGGDDVRNDFLNATNGAIKLTESELNSLDELFKLICPERDLSSTDTSEFEKQLLVAAEHMQSLLDSKNKEVIGTSYKSLKETILKIHSCNYFNKTPLELNEEIFEPPSTEIVTTFDENEAQSQFSHLTSDSKSPVSEPQVPTDQSYFRNEIPPSYQNQTVVPEALPVQGNLNFLQESQIDLDSPHIEPPILPPHSVPSGYVSNFVSAAQPTIPPPHYQQRTKEESNLSGRIQDAAVLPAVQPPSGVNFASSALQASNPAGTPADFDPGRPIPTQTYTNQSFTNSIHPMMAAVPQSYVPVTPAHAIQPPHILPAAMVAQQRNVPTSTTGGLESSILPVSSHSPPNLLPASSVAMSKMSLTVHDAKEHFVNRDFQLSQVPRESHQQNKTAAGNSHFDRINSHEGCQNMNNSQGFVGHENFSVDNSSYSSNLKRGLPPRGVARGAGGNRGTPINSSRGNRSAYRN